jgi:hypothetical protein
LFEKFEKEEEKYNRAKHTLIVGIILTSVGLPLTFVSLNQLQYIDPFYRNYSVIYSSIYGSVSLAGISITAVGAHKKEKYKPTVSVSPGEVNFSINF